MIFYWKYRGKRESQSKKLPNAYSYGFNGKESDFEIKNSGGSSYDYGARMYDPRLGRWMSVDPSSGKYAGFSPYNFVMNNPIRYIDPNGKDPIDPRTGGTYNIWLAWAAIYTIDNDKPNFKLTTDADLLEATSFSSKWYWNMYGADEQYHTGDDVAQKGYVKDQISPGASAALKGIYGKSGGRGMPGKPGTQSALSEFQEAAKAGSYTFVDDSQSESSFFNYNHSNFNFISVEGNYITKIVNMTRNSSDDDNDYNINSVTTFDTKKSNIMERNVPSHAKGGGYKKEYYRVLSVTETTQNYKDNKANGEAKSKSYTREEVIK